MFGAITQLTRERCSLCPVNCIDSDTRKPILSCVHNECTKERAGARHFFEPVDRDNRESAGILHLFGERTLGNRNERYLSFSLSLSRVGDVPWGSLAAQEKEIDTRGEFQRLRCVELELIARLPLDRGIRGRR